ncbi:MAG: hypothetical protein ACYDCK_06225, partial [Thermoplasmatota archaeon]
MSFSPGTFALWGAFLTGCATVAIALARSTTSRVALLPRSDLWLTRALRAHASFLVGALLVLILAFVVGDTSVNYVWEHTNVAYPLAYRVAGLWGGEEGTLLMWATFAAVFAVIERLRAARSETAKRDAGERATKFSEETRRWSGHTTLLLAAFTTAFTGLSLASATFAPTASVLLDGPSRVGRGLTEVLLTPFMVIHPPMQFVGYALTAMPAALALGAWSARVERDV